MKEEDKDFDGKPDEIAEFKNGNLIRVRQDTKQRGCFDVDQRFDANGNLVESAEDQNGDCKIDLWSRTQNGTVVWQARDERGEGRATVLTIFDGSGSPTHQEMRSEGRRSPDVRVFLNATVSSLDLEASGQSVQTVTVKVLKGAGFTVRARAFVLAAGGIRNPRVLLNSNTVQRSGIGNAYDNVGRYFMDHPHTDYQGVLVASPRMQDWS